MALTTKEKQDLDVLFKKLTSVSGFNQDILTSSSFSDVLSGNAIATVPRGTFDPNTFLQATVTIYVRSTGNDVTGTGTLANPYRTIARAQRDVPTILNGTGYRVDVSGYGTYTTTDPVVIQGLVGGPQTNGYGFELFATPTIDDTMAFATRSQSADAVTGFLTLTDTSKNWTVNQWKGYIFWYQNSGAAFSHTAGARIISNTATQIVVATTFAPTSAAYAWNICHESININFSDVPQYYNAAVSIIDNHADIYLTGIKIGAGSTGYAGVVAAYGNNNHRIYFGSCDLPGVGATYATVRFYGCHVHSPTSSLGGDAATSVENGTLVFFYSYIKEQYILGAFRNNDQVNVFASVIENCYGLNGMYTQEPGLSALSVFKSDFRSMPDHAIYVRNNAGINGSVSPALANLRINNSSFSAILIEHGATAGIYNVVGTGNGRYGVEVGYQGVGYGSYGHGHGIAYANSTVTGTLGDIKVGMRPTRTWTNFNATAPIGCENDFTGDGSTLRNVSSTASAMAPVLAAYTTGGRPAAASYQYLMIYNTTTNLINISDGTNWRDAAGNIV